MKTANLIRDLRKELEFRNWARKSGYRAMARLADEHIAELYARLGGAL